MKKKSQRVACGKDLELEPVYQYDLLGGGNACGYCALSAIYKYYGLNAEKLNLEALLGTQNMLPYNFPGREKIESFFAQTKKFRELAGTWPFDILAVLYWHGFDTELAYKYEPYIKDMIKAHIQSGHPVLVLGSGLGHWLVISGFRGNKFIITDSTRRKNYEAPMDDFLNKECDGLIFVSRKKGARFRRMTNGKFAIQYARGVRFCLQIAGAKINDLISKDKKETILGNYINDLFGYEEGTIVGNAINNIFG